MAVTLKGQSAIYEGTSADMKPSDADKNAIFQELDTGIDYYYDGTNWNEIPSSGGGGGGTGTDNYNELSNKPLINSVTLSGNKTAANLGLQAEITGDVTISSDNVDDTGATNLFVTSSEKSTWNGKQDALTIDSEPTESSANPVQSGGVYTALSGKQAALAFDGTYSATNNKVATESTVSGAISALDKSSVGLDNVTNNAQVKAVSGAVTSGDIVTFGADGATVQDSGKAIETSLNDSNDKVPTSKAVRDNVAANATMSSGYAADSSEASITSSTSINDAIEQLDYRTISNKNNILLSADQTTQYNIVPIKSTITTGNASVTATVAADKTITIEITGTTSTAVGFEISDNFAVDTSAQYVMTGCPSSGAVRLILQQAENPYNWIDQQYNNQPKTVTPTYSNVRYYIYIYTNSSGTVTIKPMLTPKAIFDAGFTDYQPYALSNAELTAKEQTNETNISLILNADGQKNKWDFANAPSGVMQNVITNKQADSLTIKSNGTWANIIYGCQNLPAGEYVLQCEIADYSATTETCKIGHEANLATLTPVTGNGIITHTFTKSTDSTSVQNIYFYVNWSGTSNTINTYKATKIMICEKSLYDISSSHQNYAMTNAELTAAIQALQAQLANQ